MRKLEISEEMREKKKKKQYCNKKMEGPKKRTVGDVDGKNIKE